MRIQMGFVTISIDAQVNITYKFSILVDYWKTILLCDEKYL